MAKKKTKVSAAGGGGGRRNLTSVELSPEVQTTFERLVKSRGMHRKELLSRTVAWVCAADGVIQDEVLRVYSSPMSSAYADALEAMAARIRRSGDEGRGQSFDNLVEPPDSGNRT